MQKCTGAFRQSRTLNRANTLAQGVLACMGRCTITGILCASGQQFKDWSWAYRLFEARRMDMSKIFSVIRKEAVDMLPTDEDIYAHMDDTLLRKRGKKIAGSKWLKDPLGPHFHTNFVWGQRFIGLVLSVFDKRPGSARAIPVDFHHCPIAEKPGKNATEQDWEYYKQIHKQTKMSAVGAKRIRDLREQLNQEGYACRKLIVSVDGGYTNETVIKNLPDGVTLIGRCRKDSKFYQVPEKICNAAGRNRSYGQALPTPEQIRQSDQYSWQQVEAWAAGCMHTFDVKVLRNIRWRKTGKRNLILLVIRPIAYRPTKNAKLLYRQPAYLIATDPEMDVAQLLQAYLWRWQIEVCFRDKKTLIGCGQAQVRKTVQAEKVPAFIAACYAMILLAAEKTKGLNQHLPATKWYTPKRRKRITTGDIINSFRVQSWASSMKINFSHFLNNANKTANLKKLINPSLAALFYARN